MKFKIVLRHAGDTKAIIPINYNHPLSSALYRIISKGNADYGKFLHQRGYGKGFKFFTFSQVFCPFKIIGDRMKLLEDELWFYVSFHLPDAAENFVKGLFQAEQIEIADKSSKAVFHVNSVENMANPLAPYKENEIISIQLKPLSPIVAGLQNEKGNYDFLNPEDDRFAEVLKFNWRNKIATSYADLDTEPLLMVDIIPMANPPKSRLITLKASTPQETKIRGWVNFGIKATAERRYLELLMNAGVGVYNSMGCGSVIINNLKI